jgi:hypothetical protein
MEDVKCSTILYAAMCENNGDFCTHGYLARINIINCVWLWNDKFALPEIDQKYPPSIAIDETNSYIPLFSGDVYYTITNIVSTATPSSKR